jgi:hypothetical protein
MNKIGVVIIAFGVLLVFTFALADNFLPGGEGKLGAAQLLGIESGVAFTLIGIGFITINRNREIEFGKSIALVIDRVLNLSPMIWTVSTFLVLYVSFFMYPMFFSKIKIQYFIKYIPDAWVTRIGYDVETTVNHIENWLVNEQSPYSDGVVPYSPLALALFAPLLILGYPGYYKFLTIITFSCYLLATLLIPAFVGLRKNHALLLLFSIVGLFSYGFQFEMERGQFNMIAFALSLLAIYIYHYHHKFRFFAYLFFSLSVQLKLYPLIFIFMFVKDWRDWAGNIKRVFGLGVTNFSLLFILGYQLFIEFINTITSRQLHFQSSREEDLSISGFVYYLTNEGLGAIHADRFVPYGRAIDVFFLILFGVCLFSIIAHVYVHNLTGMNTYLLAVCTVGALIVPVASFDYKLPILVAPMALMFGGLPVFQNYYKKIASIFIILVMSTAYWSTLYPYTVKPALLSRNFPALFVILISITVMYFLTGGRLEFKPVDSEAGSDIMHLNS